jgi:hypothetical protein
VVPEEDIGKLKRVGVKEIFTPGAPLDEIVRFVKALPGEARHIKKNGGTTSRVAQRKARRHARSK